MDSSHNCTVESLNSKFWYIYILYCSWVSSFSLHHNYVSNVWREVWKHFWKYLKLCFCTFANATLILQKEENLFLTNSFSPQLYFTLFAGYLISLALVLLGPAVKKHIRCITYYSSPTTYPGLFFGLPDYKVYKLNVLASKCFTKLPSVLCTLGWLYSC